MKPDGLKKIHDTQELLPGEKKYIIDCQYRMGGSFSQALFEAIARADSQNRAKLALGFPEEVQGYVAWTEGDLYDRASRVAGGDVSFIEHEKEETKQK
jgi:hypothetical protein